MSTSNTTPKKPQTSSDRRTPAATNPTPNRSPSRMAAQAHATAPNGVNRARSVRNSVTTPLSARSAARKPATASDEDDAKAELQAKLDELHERLQQSELAADESRKHADVLQIKLDEALKEQGLLEETVHEHTERIEGLELDKREATRARRELELIYETERVQAVREREEAATEKEDLANNLQRLKEALTQRELRERAGIDDDRRPSMSRTSSMRSDDALSNPDSRGDRQFAPRSSLHRSDSRSSSRLVLQKDKVIEALRLELAEAQIKLVELENQGGGTLHKLEREMYDVKMHNARLMEENESFQLLLSEKTLNGDLAQSELLRPPSHSDSHSRPSSSSRRNPRTSLADELEEYEDDTETAPSESSTDNRTRALRIEVNNLKDQNKALTVYINNIISRLLQHEQFEAILDKTPDLMAGPPAISQKHAGQGEADKEKELPPPPPQQAASEDGLQPHGFLQRAGSVLRRKPGRPVSYNPPAALAPQPVEAIDESTVHENPTTAPSIPLGRGQHRRSRSDWSAATVVSSMYKGPSQTTPGPLSPGLNSPGLSSPRGSYFASAQTRAPSGGTVPTISETEFDKENQSQPPSLPQRDSKVSSLGASPERMSIRNSNRNSFISNAGEPRGSFDITATAESSNPSSPPQSTTSSGEKDTRPSGAVMMGSKPRPLRLVQEADEEKAKKQANRASWFGAWGQTGGSFGSFLPGRTGSHEGTQGQ